MKKQFLALIIVFIIVFCGFFYSTTLQFDRPDISTEFMTRGVILNMEELQTSENDNQGYIFEDDQQWLATVKITAGDYKGREIQTIHYYGNNPAYDFMVYPGEEVILTLDLDGSELAAAYIADIARDKYLKYLAIIFVLTILAVGSLKGLKSIISLLLTGLAIIKILLPAILAGKNPILVTVFICAGITVVTMLLVSGLSKKTLSTITGTLAGVVIGGVLARVVIIQSRINGLGSEESRLFFYSFAEGKLDITGILFAGIVIGALGAVMDVAMSVASSIHEIHQVNPGLSRAQLFKSGLNVGRDIIGTMSNTLILAYTGGALPLMLLLLSSNVPFLKYINLDMLATEIIRALSGSIGLFLAVPFTALISALLYGKNRVTS